MIFNILQGILLFQAIYASMTDTFSQINSPLTPVKAQYNTVELEMMRK